MKKLIFLILLLASCVPYRYLNKHHAEICNNCIDEYSRDFPRTDTIVSKVDTLYMHSNDLLSDFYQSLYFDCDSSNHVILKGVGIAVDSIKLLKDRIKAYSRLIPSYKFEAGRLIINNKLYQDSILVLQEKITTLERSVKTITTPAIIKKVAPVWIWFYIGFSILAVAGLTILAIKK